MFRLECCSVVWCFALGLAGTGWGRSPAGPGDKEDFFAAFENAKKFAAKADYPAAAASYERALANVTARFGADETNTGAALNNLGLVCAEKWANSRKPSPFSCDSIKIKETKLGPADPDVANSLNNLANMYEDMGQYAKAEPLYQRSLKIREDKLGTDHFDVADSLNNLGNPV